MFARHGLVEKESEGSMFILGKQRVKTKELCKQICPVLFAKHGFTQGIISLSRYGRAAELGGQSSGRLLFWLWYRQTKSERVYGGKEQGKSLSVQPTVKEH